MFFCQKKRNAMETKKTSEPIDKDYIDLRIDDIMRQKGIRATDLAERMGKHKQYITNIKACGPATSLGSLIQVAKALGVPFRDLFGPGKGDTDTTDEEGQRQETAEAATLRCPHCGQPIVAKLTRG